MINLTSKQVEVLMILKQDKSLKTAKTKLRIEIQVIQ